MGSPEIDDHPFPRGKGRAESGRTAESATVAKEWRESVALVAREAGDREAGGLPATARSTLFRAMPGAAFREASAKAG